MHFTFVEFLQHRSSHLSVSVVLLVISTSRLFYSPRTHSYIPSSSHPATLRFFSSSFSYALCSTNCNIHNSEVWSLLVNPELNQSRLNSSQSRPLLSCFSIDGIFRHQVLEMDSKQTHYIAIFQSYRPLSLSYSTSHTHMYAALQGKTLYLTYSYTGRALRGNSGLGVLPRDTSACRRGGGGDRAAYILVSERASRPPEPQHDHGLQSFFLASSFIHFNFYQHLSLWFYLLSLSSSKHRISTH